MRTSYVKQRIRGKWFRFYQYKLPIQQYKTGDSSSIMLYSFIVHDFQSLLFYIDFFVSHYGPSLYIWPILRWYLHASLLYMTYTWISFAHDGLSVKSSSKPISRLVTVTTIHIYLTSPWNTTIYCNFTKKYTSFLNNERTKKKRWFEQSSRTK